MPGRVLTNRPPQPIALSSGNLGELQKEIPFRLRQDTGGAFKIINQPTAFGNCASVLALELLHLRPRGFYFYFPRHLAD
jgi:hypothetical protein